MVSPTKLASALASYLHHLVALFGALQRARQLTAAASEDRTLGLQAPVMTLSGSGNHGILCLLGVQALAEELESSREELARALAPSALTAALSKVHIKRMVVVRGCTVAAAPSLAVATAYLLSGTIQAATRAIQTVSATLANTVSDGDNQVFPSAVGTAAAVGVRAHCPAVKSRPNCGPHGNIRCASGATLH